MLLIANGPVDYLCSSDGRELAGKVRRWASDGRSREEIHEAGARFGSASELLPFLATTYLSVRVVLAAVQAFLTRLGCSIKGGSLLCEFL